MEEIFLKCDRVAASAVVQQYCSFLAIQFVFCQSSSFFANPVSFGTAQKLTGLAKNEPDCQNRTVSPGQYRFTVLTTLFWPERFPPVLLRTLDGCYDGCDVVRPLSLLDDPEYLGDVPGPEGLADVPDPGQLAAGPLVLQRLRDPLPQELGRAQVVLVQVDG